MKKMKMKKLCVAIILVAFLASMFSVVPVQAATVGLVADWNLNEGIGSIAKDTTVNNNDGILSGGKFGNALSFDGVDDYVSIGDMGLTGDWTIEFWTKIGTTVPLIQYPIGTGSGSDGYGAGIFVAFEWEGDKWGVYAGSSDWHDTIKGSQVFANVWYHIAVVKSGTSYSLFLNGVLQNAGTLGDIDIDNLQIGRRQLYSGSPEPPYGYFNGIVDEVRVSNYARYLASFGLPTSTPESDSGTAGLWHLDESLIGSVAKDSAGTKDGTINGAKWAGPTWTSGTWGTGLHFDGVDDNVRIEDDASLDLSDGITIEANICPERTTGYQTIVSKRQGQANYALRLWGGTVEFYCTDMTGGWDEWYTPSIVTSNYWYHIVATYDFDDVTSMRIFVNGIEQPLLLVHPLDSGVIVNNFPVYLGIIGGGSQQFKGIIDDVKIWNYALSELDLQFVAPSDSLIPTSGTASLTVLLTANGNPVEGVSVDFSSDPTGLTIPSGVTNAEGKVTVAASGAVGIYLITATVQTILGPISAEWTLVVYDPSGGFVTGGGWINSPEGALVGTTLTGKATFGFVSKYQKGATVPTGNTEFIFHAAGFKFKSTSYEWLVVAGTKAMYKGVGTVNGAGDYGFMLSAIDGQKTGQDLFRIRIWEIGGGVVYDNQVGALETADPTTAISGGSIVIHK